MNTKKRIQKSQRLIAFVSATRLSRTSTIKYPNDQPTPWLAQQHRALESEPQNPTSCQPQSPQSPARNIQHPRHRMGQIQNLKEKLMNELDEQDEPMWTKQKHYWMITAFGDVFLMLTAIVITKEHLPTEQKPQTVNIELQAIRKWASHKINKKKIKKYC